MSTLEEKLARYVPDWSKPLLRPLLAIYRGTKSSSEKTVRRWHAPPLPKNKDGRVYIHLGCGRINAPGFINVDAVPLPHIHYVREVDDLSVFPKEYADLIYASHVLEHISHRKVAKVLKEWRRVLKRGGILRIGVPDFDRIIELYSAEGRDVSVIMGALMGGQDYDYNFHKTIFNRKYLTRLFKSVGFRKVRKWDPRKVELHSFEDWTSKPIEKGGKKYWASLNLEAVK
jgi:predicted SAM-dependent methyltransferase